MRWGGGRSNAQYPNSTFIELASMQLVNQFVRVSLVVQTGVKTGVLTLVCESSDALMNKPSSLQHPGSSSSGQAQQSSFTNKLMQFNSPPQ